MKTILEMLPFELFRFRVLIDRDAAIVVATCLETGSVATADDQDTAIDMMVEVLGDEWEFNVLRENLRNLLHPAPISVWASWQERKGATITRDGIEWKLLPQGF